MLILILATLTTDIVLLRIYQATGLDEAMTKWFRSHMSPAVSVVVVLVVTVLINFVIRYGLDVFHASDAAKPIALGVGLGVCLSFIPLTMKSR